MTRRIPAALGIIVVIGALRELMSMVPLVMVALSTSLLDELLILYAGAAVAQLVAGIAISVGWTHARFVVVAWTLVSLALVVFTRDHLFSEGFASIAVAVELLAGPAIVWVAPMLAGDTPPRQIPRAQIAGATPAADPVDAGARRFDVGVVLFGIGILWIVNSVLSHVATFAMLLRADHVSGAGGIAAELVYLVFAISVGVLAIRAAKRCLDPRVEGQLARRALATFVLVAVIGTLMRTALMVGYVVLVASTGEQETSLLVNSISVAVIGCATPLFLWFYAQPALAYRAEGPPPLPPPARLASTPAWALLWIAPFLLVRVFAARIYDVGTLANEAFLVVGIACALEGVVFVIAAIATLAATRASPPSGAVAEGVDVRTPSIARAATMIGLGVAILAVAGWLILVVTTDQPMSVRGPLGSLVQLVACTATLWWALSPRR